MTATLNGHGIPTSSVDAEDVSKLCALTRAHARTHTRTHARAHVRAAPHRAVPHRTASKHARKHGCTGVRETSACTYCTRGYGSYIEMRKAIVADGAAAVRACVHLHAHIIACVRACMQVVCKRKMAVGIPNVEGHSHGHDAIAVKCVPLHEPTHATQCPHAHAHVHTHMRAHMHTRTRTHMHARVPPTCPDAHVHICTHACTCACVCAHACARVLQLAGC